LNLRFLSLICLYIFFYSSSLFSQTGWLKIESNIDSIDVVIDFEFFKVYRIANGDSLELRTGVRAFHLSYPFDYDYNRRVNIKEDETLIFEHNFEKRVPDLDFLDKNISATRHYSAEILLMSDSDTRIYVDDELKGEGFALVDSISASSTIKFENKYGYKTSKRYITSENRLITDQQYLKPIESNTKKAAFIPGSSQFMKNQKFKGSAIVTTFLLGTASTIFFELKLQSNNDKYSEVLSSYNATSLEFEAFKFGNQLKELSDKSSTYNNIKNVSLFSTIAVYLYNIYDGFTSFPDGGFREEKGLDFYLSSQDFYSFQATNATLKFNF
jgi:hypothetical protein